ncbi:MAG: glutaredoxin family protein [Betaproteobacteria bacterium]|nr:glutaredoxin family protein [Betaproteobacteria bacterium]
MPTLIQLRLYTTSNCHLCEQAIELISSQYNITLALIEIADDDELIALYGTRIPVLQKVANPSNELKWPFNQEDILNFISR